MPFITSFILRQRMERSDAPDVKTGLAFYEMCDCRHDCFQTFH